jgi:hypothetical protein
LALIYSASSTSPFKASALIFKVLETNRWIKWSKSGEEIEELTEKLFLAYERKLKKTNNHA